jgi:hypothetical protein
MLLLLDLGHWVWARSFLVSPEIEFKDGNRRDSSNKAR